jgi:general secretion pathway protein A
MRVILLGQPELKQAVLDIPQLAQRVKLFFHLEGLTLAETTEYIDYRLLVSGHGDQKLFDGDTVREMHRLSKGIPRLINKLCDGMMMCAYSEDRPFIDPHDLKSIRRDLLGEEAPEDTPKPPLLKKREHPISERNGQSKSDMTGEMAGMTNALLRMAEAMERIDSRLACVFQDERAAQREGIGKPDNVKPLSPGRK